MNKGLSINKGTSDLILSADKALCGAVPSQAIEEIKEALNKIADVCEALTPIVEGGEMVGQEIDHVCTSFTLIMKYGKELSTSIKTVSNLCLALEGLPVVGSFLGAVHKGLGIAEKPINGINSIAQKMTSGVNSAKQTGKNLARYCNIFDKELKFASSNFRNYANSLYVLNSSLELLTALSNIITDASLKKKLLSILECIEKEIKMTAAAIHTEQQAISEIQTEIGKVNDFVEATVKPFHSFADVISTVCGTISQIFSPIANVLNKIIDAIAPIKWLLKAISWLFSILLNPIVNKLLDWLGINKLIEALEKMIYDALHINQLESEINSIVDTISEQAVSPILNGVERVQEDIKKDYNQIEQLTSLDSFAEQVMEFLEETYKEFRDQELPDWPFDALQIDKWLSEIHIVCTPIIPTKFEMPVKDAQTVYLHCIADDFVEEYKSDTRYGADFAHSLSEMEGLIQQCNVLYGRMQDVMARVTLCEKYTRDITLYRDLADDLVDCLDALKGIGYFESLGNLVEKLEVKITAEKTKIEMLEKTIKVCEADCIALNEKFLEYYKNLPGQSDVDKLYEELFNIADSYNSAYSMVDKSSAETKSKVLQTLDDELRANMGKVKRYIGVVQEMQGHVTGADEQITSLLEQIDGLSNEEWKIIDSKFYHSISSVNQYLVGILAILLPAVQLVNFFIEKEKEKEKCEIFLKGLKAYIDRIGSVISKILDSGVFDGFAELLLPFDEVLSDMEAVDASIRGFDFTNMEMVAVMAEVLTIQVEMCEYVDADGNVVQNLYVDQEMYNTISSYTYEE